jgi:hypothetical protein
VTGLDDFSTRITPRYRSAEHDREGLHAGIEELDVEVPVGDGPGLTYQLVEPLLVESAVALSSTSKPCAVPGRPSMSMWNRGPGSRDVGLMTRWRSRAWSGS